MSEYRITVDLFDDTDAKTAEDIRKTIAGVCGVLSVEMTNLEGSDDE
jgi:cell division protein FtsX